MIKCFNIENDDKKEMRLTAIDHNNDKLYAIGGSSITRLYKFDENTNEFKIHKYLKISKNNSKVGTTDLQFNKINSKILASASYTNSQVGYWEIDSSANFNLLGSHDSLINKISWHYTHEKILASVSKDSFLKIWSLNDKKATTSLNLNQEIKDCQYSPLNEHHLLVSFKGPIVLYDTRFMCEDNYGGKNIMTYYNHTDETFIDWCPNNRDLFISGSGDKSFAIWNINENSPIIKYKSPARISKIKFWKTNPQYIVTAFNQTNYISLWNLKIKNIYEYIFKGNNLSNFCWNENDTKLMTLDNDNIIVHDFFDGNNILNTFSTNFCKMYDEDKFLFYSDTFVQKNKLEIQSINIEDLCRKNEPKSYFILLKKIDLAFVINKSNLEEIFKRFKFIVNKKYLKEKFFDDINLNDIEGEIDSFKNNGERLKMLLHIQSIIEHNLNQSSNFKFYHYYISFKEMEYIINCPAFTEAYIKGLDNSFIINVLHDKIRRLVEFLIESINDIILASLIILIFKPFLEFDYKLELKLLHNSIEILKSYKLHVQAAKLLKLSNDKIISMFTTSIGVNTQLLFSCKSCRVKYDSNKPGECTCLKSYNCNICGFRVFGGLINNDLYNFQTSINHIYHSIH